jgi:hypothetical protein
MKPFRTYLLSLCILLLSGYNQLSAHTGRISYASPVKQSDCVKLNSGQNSSALNANSAAFGTEKQNSGHHRLNFSLFERTEKEEEEYEEFISFRKYLGSGNYPGFIFSTQTVEHFFNASQKIVPLYRCSSNTTSCRYLIFEVFRI